MGKENIYCKVVVGGKITDIYQFETWEDYEQVSDSMPDGEQLIPIQKAEFIQHVEQINRENEELDRKNKDMRVEFVMDEGASEQEDAFGDNLRLKVIALDFYKSQARADLADIKRVYEWLREDLDWAHLWVVFEPNRAH